MLMVTDFWGVETRGTSPRLVWFRQDYDAGLIQDDVHTKLEIDGAQGWTDHLPWSHVEGGAGLRGYGVRIQRIEAYSASGKASET